MPIHMSICLVWTHCPAICRQTREETISIWNNLLYFSFWTSYMGKETMINLVTILPEHFITSVTLCTIHGKEINSKMGFVSWLCWKDPKVSWEEGEGLESSRGRAGSKSWPWIHMLANTTKVLLSAHMHCLAQVIPCLEILLKSTLPEGP